VTGGSTLRLFPNVTDKLAASHFKDFPYDFTSDVAQGNLPAFSFLDYNGSLQSMECPENVVLGDQLIYDVVESLMTGPKWNQTLLIINFDEHGGFYDHVPPVPAIAPDDVLPVIPAADLAKGYYQYSQYRKTGFRVPLIMVSPYAKKDYISHVVHEQTSVLSLLEHKYNLPALSCRDANANNFYDMIDFDALASQTPNFPDMESVGLTPPTYEAAMLDCTTADPGVLPAPGSVVQVANGTGPDFSPKCEIV
jgi:phospholipase C